MARKPESLLRAACAVALLAPAAYLAAVRLGHLAPRPRVMAALVVSLSLLVVAVLARAVLALVRRRRLADAFEATAAAGLLAALAAGLANWGLGVQGAVLLMEREPVRLASRDRLVALQAGPFLDGAELDVTLALARLRLEPVGADGFRAVSSLRVLDAAGVERGVSVASDERARAGALLLHQGVFGFAPRVVVTRAGATVFDAHVPFRTVRAGAEGMAFVEDFEIAAEKLLVRAAVTLDDLNDDLKGHPRLELGVERGAALLGRGSLRPGEFVELDGGLRVGFAGLQRWSEIVFSRQNYGGVVIGAALLSAASALAWVVAAWRRW